VCNKDGVPHYKGKVCAAAAMRPAATVTIASCLVVWYFVELPCYENLSTVPGYMMLATDVSWRHAVLRAGGVTDIGRTLHVHDGLGEPTGRTFFVHYYAENPILMRILCCSYGELTSTRGGMVPVMCLITVRVINVFIYRSITSLFIMLRVL